MGLIRCDWRDRRHPRRPVEGLLHGARGAAGTDGALFAAVPQGRTPGAGRTRRPPTNIISNGTAVVVPEGYGLVLIQHGAITGFAAEAGGYELAQRDDNNSKSIFAGDGIVSPLDQQTSWERFKFGGQPGSQQRAFFVTLKELPNNRSARSPRSTGTTRYLNAQVGAVTRGTYTLKIVDPILFIKNFVPATYLRAGRVSTSPTSTTPRPRSSSTRSSARSRRRSRCTRTTPQGQPDHEDPAGLGRFRADPVAGGRERYQWRSDRGLAIAKVRSSPSSTTRRPANC